MSDSFNETVVMSALCIYEYILEEVNQSNKQVNDSNPFWRKMQEDIGAYELRQKAINLAPLLDCAWEEVHPDLFDDSYDWEFVPKLLNEARDLDSDNFLSWDSEKWKSFAIKLFSSEEKENLQNDSDKPKNYRVELESGEVIESDLSLNEAEDLLCRCCNDGLDAYLTNE